MNDEEAIPVHYGEPSVHYNDLVSALSGTRLGNPYPAELIPDKLWLASLAQTTEKQFIDSKNITHIVNLAGKDCDSSIMLQRCPTCKHYKSIEAEDIQGYDIFQHYTEVEEYLKSALSEGGRVVVHCVAGVNRSAALCIAFLALYQGSPLLDVVRAVKAKRPSILSNYSFRVQLLGFVQQHQTQLPQQHNPPAEQSPTIANNPEEDPLERLPV
eukprot:TRINITY_DN94262_c0_g1_i1.p1 TRINITY_DN94262_c0_g1~~TRINITY_DN94262_c0_g1_i1.p1  ORF type:complete len:213 (+),score=9.99 TRINITY_DN94262_c0_g1_i1:44-682(+)